MARKGRKGLSCRRVELDGVRYVILRESVFEFVCKEAGMEGSFPEEEESLSEAMELDRAKLAEKLVKRRLAAGLSQAELGLRAGVRVETVNRIERGRTDPDFATMRKLVTALKKAEQEQLTRPPAASRRKE
jgi:DNA-binding XRE family transcriptional regulator